MGTHTEADREFERRRRKVRRESGLCTVCGREDAYTMAGRAMCAICAQKSNEWTKNKKKRPKYREAARKASKERYAKMIAENICPTCYKKKPDDGYSLCEFCRVKHRNRKKEKRNREGQRTWEMALSGETCFFCKSPDVVPGKKLCQACIDKRVAYLHGEKHDERKKKRDQNLPGVQNKISAYLQR